MIRGLGFLRRESLGFSGRRKGQNQSLEKTVTAASDGIYGREYKEEKKRQKRTRQKTEASTMAVRPALKQPEQNARRDPGKKGWACYYCGKDRHLKQDCPQASKLPSAPCLVCKDHTGEETALRGVGPRGQALRTIRTEGAQGSPHKLPS